MQIRNYRKIMILGDSGRGKTTFAKKLAEILKLPHFSTDDFYWEKKFTKERDKEESKRLINENIYNSDSGWVVDGSTKHLIRNGLESCDVIYLFLFKNIFQQYWSLIKRHIKRRFSNNNNEFESFYAFYQLLKHVTKKKYIKSYKSHHSHLMALIEPYMDKVQVFHSFKEQNEFLNKLRKNDTDKAA